MRDKVAKLINKYGEYIPVILDLDSETLDKIYEMPEEEAKKTLEIRKIIMDEVQKEVKRLLKKLNQDTREYYL